MINQPISIYNNWSAYDELSDNVPLTEELAMRELDEVLRLRKHGVRIDGYLMDAFWFDPDSGYRTWRKPNWPNGPGGWLSKCLENDITPGLWFSTNGLCGLNPIPEWEDSLTQKCDLMCMFTGGFMDHFTESLQIWYDHGIRIYKFDFARFDAATPEVALTHTPEEIIRQNQRALKTALKLFRQRNPNVIFTAYNGFGGDQDNTSLPIRKCVDTDWLTVFDSLYCGDPRPSDVPTMEFWRSMDIYSDHMVRFYEANGLPLERIDNTAFMIGKTGTCYHRMTQAWKGMYILTLARGGWVNYIYGNLELLSDEDTDWLAKTQSMYLNLQALGRVYTFGGLPGKSEPYGYAGIDNSGSVYTVVNPSQSIAEIELPQVSDWCIPPAIGRILFRDAGFEPQLSNSRITLGPEQMAVVGFGRYASGEFDLGIQEDVVIPADIRLLTGSFEQTDKNTVTATIDPPQEGNLRIVMQQFDDSGLALRISGGAPPDGTTMDQLLRISVSQNGAELPVQVNYNKAIWSGLSWAVGEISSRLWDDSYPIQIRCSSTYDQSKTLKAMICEVKYD